MLKTLYIPLDTTIDNTVQCDKLVKRGDTLILTVKVFSNGELADMTGQSIDLILKKSDNTIIENTLNSNNISNGVITATLEQQATVTSGIVSGELQIYTSGTLTSSNTFTFEVKSSLADDVLEISKNDIKVLNDLRALINQGQIEINKYNDSILAIGNTVEAIEALANIKAYIDTNLPALQSENAEAVVNIPALKTENDKASTLTTNLKAENDKAPQLIIDLKTENNKAPNLIDDLTSVNNTAEELKNTLETDITNANSSKEALNTSKTNADNTKNALDQSVEAANNFVSAHGDIIDLDNRVTANTTQLSDIVQEQTTQNNNIANKVDKITGKGLSTNDYDNTEKAQVITNKNDITTIKSQIASLASGAPKAVSLISQMTDTTKNYVYTGTESGYANGNWYYWNGSAWVSGGVYQSTGIADKSVTLAKTEDYISDKIEKTYPIINSDFAFGIPAIDGSASSTPRTFVMLYPATFDGLLKSVTAYFKVIGSVKIKVISKVSGNTYNVEADSGEIIISSTGAVTLQNGVEFSDLNIKEGQYIGLYFYNGAKIAYQDIAESKLGSFSGDANGNFTVTTVNAKANINFTVQGGLWKSNIDTRLSNAETSVTNIKKDNLPYISDYNAILGSNVISGSNSSTNRTYFTDSCVATMDSKIKKINMHIKTAGNIKIKILEKIEDDTLNYRVVEETGIIAVNVGFITLTDAVDFNNLYVKKGQYVAIFLASAVISYSTTTESLYFYIGEATGISTFGKNLNQNISLNVEVYGAGWKNSVDKFIDTEKSRITNNNVLFSTKFRKYDALPSGMITNGTWAIDNCLKALANTTEAYSYVIWDKISMIDKATVRTRVKIDTHGSFAVIRKSPTTENKQGTVAQIDTLNNTIKLYNWDNSTPITGAKATFNITNFVFVEGNEYLISLTKDTSFIKVKIIDCKTQLEQEFSYDNQQYVYSSFAGKCWGSPGVMYFGTGSFTFYNLDFIANFPKRLRCIVMGDSITEGYGLNTINQPLSVRWCEKLQNDLNGLVAISGAGGQTSSGLIQRLDLDFKTYESDYCIILIGFNDVNQNVPIETIKSNILTIIKAIRDGNSMPILGAIPQKSPANSTISDLNTWIRALGYTVIGFDYALSTNGDGSDINASYITDVPHPNVEGNNRMYNQVKIDAPFLLD